MELCNLNSKYDDVNLMLGLEKEEGFGGCHFVCMMFSGSVLVLLKSAKDRFVERAPMTTCTTMRLIWYGLASK